MRAYLNILLIKNYIIVLIKKYLTERLKRWRICTVVDEKIYFSCVAWFNASGACLEHRRLHRRLTPVLINDRETVSQDEQQQSERDVAKDDAAAHHGRAAVLGHRHFVVAVSLHLMTSNATGWMAPVVTSLENEETSFPRAPCRCASRFCKEVVAQIFDEINLARDFATKILSYDFVKTSGTMPVNAYHYTLPLSVDPVGILEYDKNKIKTYTTANRVCSTIVNQNNLKNCWFDPEIPLTSGRVIEGSTASPSGEKLTVSLRTTGVYWPHPKATGKMGPYMPGCEGDKYSTHT